MSDSLPQVAVLMQTTKPSHVERGVSARERRERARWVQERDWLARWADEKIKEHGDG